MSVTITQRPQLLTPVMNPMRVVVSGTNTGQAQFRYLFEVFKGATKIGQFKSDLLPGNLGMCDLSETIKSEIIPQKPDVNQFGWLNVLDTFVDYSVQVRETYVSGGVAVSGSPTTISGTAFYGAFSQIGFRSYASGSYIFPSGVVSGTYKPMTNMRATSLGLNDMLYLDIYTQPVTGSIINLQAEQEGFSATVAVPPTPNISSPTSRWVRVGMMYEDILQRFGTVPFQIDTTRPWVLRVGFQGAESNYSEPITILPQPCSRYDTQRVYFRNKLGGIDGFTFTMKNRKSLNATKTTYGKNSDVFGTEVFEDVVSGEYQEQFELTSDWLTDSEYSWLWELVTAPQVWLLIGGVLIEAIVETENYRFITRKNDKLQPLQITLRSAYKNTFA